MAIYRVQGPDGGVYRLEGPDDATPQQVEAFAQQQFAAPKTQEPAYNPTQDMSSMDKFLAGVGKGMVDIGRGAGQMVGFVKPEDVAASRKLDAPLMQTGEGIGGSVVGNLAALAPALAIPGANTVLGSAGLGALSGALQPTTSDESRLKNTALGGALGGGSQLILGKAANLAGNALAGAETKGAASQAQNAVTDTAIQEAKNLGYKTVPSVSNGSLAGRLIEGGTGKIKAAQLASVKNQPVTDALVRKGLGLSEEAPLVLDTMKGVRANASASGYDPIRSIPRMETDDAFRQQISQLTSRADNAAKDFGALVNSDVKPLAEGLASVKSFTGDTAVDAAAIFREKASDLYASGNKTLGKAYRQAAEAVEAQIERDLAKSGKDGAAMLNDFRAARTRMAQTFDVEKALREGQGKVDATVLGKLYAKNPSRMTGELASVGKAAAAMPEVMRLPKEGWANPITALDSGFATFGGILAGNPAPLAYPFSRAAGRYGLMSKAGQSMFTSPNYGPGLLAKGGTMTLEEMKKRGLAGLLGPSVYAAQ